MVKALRIERGSYRKDAISSVFVVESKKVEDFAPTPEMIINELEERIALFDSQIKAVEENAFKKGYEQGKRDGVQEGVKAVEPAMESVMEIIASLSASMPSVWDSIQSEMHKLTLGIAKKVIGQFAEQHADLVLELTKKCVKMVSEQTRLTIYVSPLDVELLRSFRGEILAVAEGVKEIEIRERMGMQRGGVMIETNVGQIDARIEEQYKAIEHALRPDWSNPNGNGKGEEH